MKTPNNQHRARGFIHALLLAVLLNLSGHMFLHLGDAVLEAEGTHFTTHEAPSKGNAPPHQCSVCQDHQQLALDAPATAAYFLAACLTTPPRHHHFPPVATPLASPSDRAPPRS